LPFRFAGHIARWLLRIASVLLLGSVVLFFVLTHTEAGRDLLRQQLELAFRAAVNGQLHIEQLEGNFVYGLYARNVQIRDTAGRLVLAVDSVALQPSWRLLLQHTLAFRRLELYNPLLLLHYDHGTWNLNSLLGRPDQSASTSRWSFTVAHFRIIGGTIQSRRTGDPPPIVAQQTLQDFTEAKLDSLILWASIDLRPGQQLIDLWQFSAHMTAPVTLPLRAAGQILHQASWWQLSRFMLQAGSSWLTTSAEIGLDSTRRTWLDLTLHPSHVDPGSLRLLFPRFPLVRALDFTGRLRGPLNALQLTPLSLASGSSLLRIEGTVQGLPDSLAFTTTLSSPGLRLVDLAALWPEPLFPTSVNQHGLLTLRAELKGALSQLQPVTLRHLEGRLRLAGLPGIVSGSFHLTRTRPNMELTYRARGRLERINLQKVWTPSPLEIPLNGRFELHGSGSKTITFHVHLLPIPFGGQGPDSLRLTVQQEGQQLWATLTLPQAQGVLTATAYRNANPNEAHFSLHAVAQQFDLGPYLDSDTLRTELNATLLLQGAGHSWEGLAAQATLRVDSSLAERSGRRYILPPTTVELLWRAEAYGHHLQLQGDLLEASVNGLAPPQPLWQLMQRWRKAVGVALAEQFDKPLYRSPQAQPASSLPGYGGPEVAAQGWFRLKKPEWMQVLLGWPAWQTDLRGVFQVQAGVDTLALSVELQADSLQLGSLRQHRMQGQLQLATGLPVSQHLTALLELQSAQLTYGRQTLGNIRLVAYLQPGGGQLSLSSQPDTLRATLRLTATLDLLEQYNRLTVQEIFWQVWGYQWQLEQPAQIDLYADAVQLHRLNLIGRLPSAVQGGRVSLQGLLSDQPSDTAYVVLQDVSLDGLLKVTDETPWLGGQLNGALSLVGALGTPQLAGYLRVNQLRLKEHGLGTLLLVSHYMPGSPLVALDAQLVPDTTLHTANRLRLRGTLQLPSATSAGALNLRLETAHAEAFFFEYIFPDLIANVQGHFSGNGRITGTFRRPIFEAAMQLHAGAFDIPRFNLHYTVEGPVRVDRDGIVLEDVRLRDPTGGRAQVQGRIDFNDYRFFSFGLIARLSGLQVMNVTSSRTLPFYGRIWGNGTFTLNGPLYSALLATADGEVLSQSEIYIPLAETGIEPDEAFIIFADSTGQLPQQPQRRPNLLASRPPGERPFLDGLDLDVNLLAPQGTTVRLVIDPLLGDVLNARSNGRLQIIRQQGEFKTFGQLNVIGGDYLFTAGEVFVRRFLLEGGTITWDGDPINARLDIEAAYRTRASRAGLPGTLGQSGGLIPLIVQMRITGRVETPQVNLRLAIDRATNEPLAGYEGIETLLNQPERSAEYATSVLLTNSFLLTTEQTNSEALTFSGNQLAFNSLSQLVASQLNRYLNQMLPNVDVLLGVQGESAQRLDVTYGVALRLLNERLVIRGQGVYRGESTNSGQQNLLGEFAIEMRLTPNVSVQVFYRREDDVLNDYTLTSTAGAGLFYQTDFPTWRRLWHRLFGWLSPNPTNVTSPPLTQRGNNSDGDSVQTQQ
jgi:translocation and assembly module TamB